MTRTVLTVVASHAAVRDAPAPSLPRAELFERLAAWAIVHASSDGPASALVRDDVAGFLACAQTLTRGDALMPRIAREADQLRTALLHGKSSARDAAHAFSDAKDDVGQRAELHALFVALADADTRLQAAHRVDRAGALLRALALLERGERPRFLAPHHTLVFAHLDEPTPLELALVVALAHSTLHVRVLLPLDPLDRGLLGPSQATAAALEKRFDAEHLSVEFAEICAPHAAPDTLPAFVAAFYGPGTAVHAPVDVRFAADEAAEAAAVAGLVRSWRAVTPGARVAVCMRSFGERRGEAQKRERFVDALVREGLPVRLPRRALAQTPAGRLVLDGLALVRDGAPRDRLLAFLTNPALTGALTPEDGAFLLTRLRTSAARSDVEDDRRGGGYRHRLMRRVAGIRTDAHARESADDILLALAMVERGLNAVAGLPRAALVPDHLRQLRAFAQQHLDAGLRIGAVEVLQLLEDAEVAARLTAAPGDKPMPVATFALLLEQLLALRAVPRTSADAFDDDDAVELLPLPDLRGRHFDHVVLVGCVEGELPRVSGGERLLTDADRSLLHRRVGRDVLRLQDDDPLATEVVSRAQAAEPFHFLQPFLAARTSVCLIAPRRDVRGRDLAPSAFLLEALRVLARGDAADAQASTESRAAPPSQLQRALALGRRAAAGQSLGAVSDDVRAQLELAVTMSRQRTRFFFRDPAVPMQAVRAPFAFAVDPARIARAHGAAFGLSPQRPLTPTRLEALAACRIHGFLQHVLKVNVDAPAGNAADARVIGTLAHAVLEEFFVDRQRRGVPATRITPADRAQLVQLLTTHGNALMEGLATGHLAAIRAQVAWLRTALVRAVSMLAQEPVVAGVEPFLFEVGIGTGAGIDGQPMAAVPLDVSAFAQGEPAPLPTTLYVGGVIDRVDQGPGGRAVIDYKTSGTSAIKSKVKDDALFESHFQLLLYLRLLEHHRPTAPQVPLHGYLVSVRDGTTSDDVHKVPELRARVLDDTRADGLAAGIARVVLPVLGGVLPPDIHVRCDECRLKRVCRVPLAAEFAPDLDDVDQGTGV